MGVYESAKKALQDILIPQLRALQAEIRCLGEKIETSREQIGSGYKRLDEKKETHSKAA